MKKCFELIDDDHSKFWTVEVIGVHYLVTFGRIGSPEGQTQIKDCDTPAEAQAKADKMVNAKVNKGYQRVADGAHPGAKASLVAALKPEAKAVQAEPLEAPHTPGRRRIVTKD